jgi:hypothetical protein
MIMCTYTDQLKGICGDYNNRIATLEEQKYDLEFMVSRKDFEVRKQAHLNKAWSVLIVVGANVIIIYMLLNTHSIHFFVDNFYHKHSQKSKLSFSQLFSITR